MTKTALSLALSTAIAVAMAAAPSEAATKKKAKESQAAQVTVNKYPGAVGMFHNCVNTGIQLIPVIGGPISAVGCGVVWAGPVLVQSFIWRV